MTKEIIFTVYVLRTSGNTLYTGQTNNLDRRLSEHQKKSTKSAKYVRRFETFELVYMEEYDSRAKSMAREAEIKRMTRGQKDRLIGQVIKNNSVKSQEVRLLK